LKTVLHFTIAFCFFCLLPGCCTQKIITQPEVYNPAVPIPLRLDDVEFNGEDGGDHIDAQDPLPQNATVSLDAPKQLLSKYFTHSEDALSARLTVTESKTQDSKGGVGAGWILLDLYTLMLVPISIDGSSDNGLSYSLHLEVPGQNGVLFDETGKGSASYHYEERADILTIWFEHDAAETARGEEIWALVPRTAFQAALSDLMRKLDARRVEIIDLTKRANPLFKGQSGN
jgi:hypothetical protein